MKAVVSFALVPTLTIPNSKGEEEEKGSVQNKNIWTTVIGRSSAVTELQVHYLQTHGDFRAKND